MVICLPFIHSVHDGHIKTAKVNENYWNRTKNKQNVAVSVGVEEIKGRNLQSIHQKPKSAYLNFHQNRKPPLMIQKPYSPYLDATTKYIDISLHLARKYTRIFVHYLFQEANSFSRAKRLYAGIDHKDRRTIPRRKTVTWASRNRQCLQTITRAYFRAKWSLTLQIFRAKGEIVWKLGNITQINSTFNRAYSVDVKTNRLQAKILDEL